MSVDLEIFALRQQLDELSRKLRVLEESWPRSSSAKSETNGVEFSPDRAPSAAATAPGTPVPRRRLLKAFPIIAAGVGAAAVGEVMGASPAAASNGAAVIQGAVNSGTKTTVITTSTGSGPPPQTALSVEGGLSADEIGVIADLTVSGSGTFEGALGGEASLVVSGSSLAYNARTAAIIHGAVTGHSGYTYGAPALVIDGVTGPLVEITLNDGATPGPTEAGVPTPGTAIQVRADNMATGLDVQVGNGGSAVLAGQSNGSATTTVMDVRNAGTGRTVYAECASTKSYNAVITGTSNGPGTGVWGQHNGASGYGVVGESNNGVGGRFRGGAANLRLIPSPAATHPTTGVAGYLFLDSAIRLWFCTKSSATGVAAVWKQIG